MCKKAKVFTQRFPSCTSAHSVFDIQCNQGSLYIAMTWPLLVPCFTRNHIWPLVIFSLVIQPGIFLKAIMNSCKKPHVASSHFPVAGTGKLKLSSSLASSCALILILTSCEGGFDSCCGLLMRGTSSSQTPASSFLSPELEPKITIPGEMM